MRFLKNIFTIRLLITCIATMLYVGNASALSSGMISTTDVMVMDINAYDYKHKDSIGKEDEKRYLGLKKRDLIICSLFLGGYLFVRRNISRKSDL